MSSPVISYTPRNDTSTSAEITALSNIYKFVLDCHAKNRDPLPDKSGPDDAERDLSDSASDHSTA
jgi:hypothetical protein